MHKKRMRLSDCAVTLRMPTAGARLRFGSQCIADAKESLEGGGPSLRTVNALAQEACTPEAATEEEGGGSVIAGACCSHGFLGRRHLARPGHELPGSPAERARSTAEVRGSAGGHGRKTVAGWGNLPTERGRLEREGRLQGSEWPEGVRPGGGGSSLLRGGQRRPVPQRAG